MALLRKNVTINYTPPTPGNPGHPGSPYVPAYCIGANSWDLLYHNETIADWFSCSYVLTGEAPPPVPQEYTTVANMLIPVYGRIDTGLVGGQITGIVGWRNVPAVPPGYSGISYSATTTNSTVVNASKSRVNAVEECINFWNSTGLVSITRKDTPSNTGTWRGFSSVPFNGSIDIAIDYNVCFPEKSAVPAVPASPPTPAVLQVVFNEGWNASAQSRASVAIGEAAKFRVAKHTRGALVGLAHESWFPSVNTLRNGIMFANGVATVYENGVFKEALGRYDQDQEFVIGRTLDNYIMYMNSTDSQAIIKFQHPACAETPLNVFALLFYGGDEVYI